MNKETHEQEIEVELLNPEEIKTQEEEIDFSVFALDGDLIEELYQEQKLEQQAGGISPDHVEKESTSRAEERTLANPEETTPGRMAQAEKEERDREGQADGDHPEKQEMTESGAAGVVDVAQKADAADRFALPEESNTADRFALPEESDTADRFALPEESDAADRFALPEESDAADRFALPEESDAADRFALPEESGAVSGSDDGSKDAEESVEDMISKGIIAEGMAAAGITRAVEEANSDTAGTEEESPEEATEKKPKKKKSVFRTILKSILFLFEVFILAFIVYVVAIVVQSDSTTDLISRLSQSMLGKAVLSAMIEEEYESNVQETIDSEQISTNEGLDVTPYTLEGDYTSFVIFGVDARGDEFDSGTNSDTIIIVTIQNETGRVRMASIYRDTYLQIESNDGGVHYAKANSAYSGGGAVRAINMLNTNFDLALEDYVVVNFTGVADIIDELGGLDITLSEGEVEQLNYHLAGSMYATGLTASKVTSAGLNHLNGVQALTYARIRKTTFTDPETGEEYNNDYGRTKRQQYVISLLAAKAKEASVSELTSIVNRVFSYNTDDEKVIGTTYAFDEIVSMIPLALNFTLDGGEGYPDNKTTMIMSDLNGADCVIAADLVSDVTALHEYLYDEEDYSPTATVRNIADTILERAAAYGTSD